MKSKKGLVTGVVLAVLVLTGCGSNHYEYFQGKDGAAGAKGSQGDAGQDGQNGQDGEDGADATPVTVVKLCPGVTVYPSKFVEIAFCIGGKLYGTYSQNGGFSTEMPPGTYGSNGINSNCNFTVAASCTINN